jgi:hypothetical protein
MGRTMNPSNWEPPHLLVVEWVDWTDTGGDGFDGWIECPYPIREYTTYTDPGLEPGWSGRGQRTEWGHDALHYCTINLNMGWRQDRPVKPRLTMRSTWRDWNLGVELQCARIEINASAGAQYGTCMYHECAGNAGLQDALADWSQWRRWRNGEIPKPDPALPDDSGSYPVYYWSDGQGEDYRDGLTFERPERTNDFWEDDVPTRIFHTSSAPV